MIIDGWRFVPDQRVPGMWNVYAPDGTWCAKGGIRHLFMLTFDRLPDTKELEALGAN